ncbi:hypothetical protein MMC25_004973 [Agyrium rufum]|nr:hypothetical protein [Agyrium rufum]
MGSDDKNYYKYTPSEATALVAFALFLLTCLLHTWQYARTKTWFFTALLIGAYSCLRDFVADLCPPKPAVEWIGYIARYFSAKQNPNYTLGPFIVQILGPLLGPTLFLASIYMWTGRVMIATKSENYSIVRQSFLTKIFVTGDVVAFLTQALGGSLETSNTVNTLKIGKDIVLAGLAIQIFNLFAFMCVALVFTLRLRRQPTLLSTPEGSPLRWQKSMLVIGIASLLILIRSVYRMVEYGEGINGWLDRHEWTFYVFDSLLMFVVLVLFNVVHPSEVKAAIRGGRFSTKAGFGSAMWEDRGRSGDTEPIQGGNAMGPFAGSGKRGEFEQV